MNIIPGDMLPSGIGKASGSVKNAFGGGVTLGVDGGNTQFTIKFDGLGKETCASLASSDWGSDGLVKIDVNGTSYAYGAANVVLPLPPATAISSCSGNGATNYITWTYY